MDKSREQFEEWVAKMRGDNHAFLPKSIEWFAFEAWQASRQALVVELPAWDEYDTPKETVDAMKRRLDRGGIKWTE